MTGPLPDFASFLQEDAWRWEAKQRKQTTECAIRIVGTKTEHQIYQHRIWLTLLTLLRLRGCGQSECAHGLAFNVAVVPIRKSDRKGHFSASHAHFMSSPNFSTIEIFESVARNAKRINYPHKISRNLSLNESKWAQVTGDVNSHSYDRKTFFRGHEITLKFIIDVSYVTSLEKESIHANYDNWIIIGE